MKTPGRRGELSISGPYLGFTRGRPGRGGGELPPADRRGRPRFPAALGLAPARRSGRPRPRVVQAALGLPPPGHRGTVSPPASTCPSGAAAPSPPSPAPRPSAGPASPPLPSRRLSSPAPAPAPEQGCPLPQGRALPSQAGRGGRAAAAPSRLSRSGRPFPTRRPGFSSPVPGPWQRREPSCLSPALLVAHGACAPSHATPPPAAAAPFPPLPSPLPARGTAPALRSPLRPNSLRIQLLAARALRRRPP